MGESQRQPEELTPEAAKGAAGNEWWVSPRYIVSSRDRGDVEVMAKLIQREDSPLIRQYQPLKDTPDLFVRFARLPEEISEDVMLEWVREYGTLGPDRLRESLARFEEEARAAKRVLTLFELATAEGGDTRQIEDMLGNAEIAPGRYAIEDRPDAVEAALAAVSSILHPRLMAECYPTVRQNELGAPFRPVSGFRSLLGAMCLQARALLTENDLRRCQVPGCGRIIPAGSQEAQIYCEPACKQRVSDRA